MTEYNLDKFGGRYRLVAGKALVAQAVERTKAEVRGECYTAIDLENIRGSRRGMISQARKRLAFLEELLGGWDG